MKKKKNTPEQTKRMREIVSKYYPSEGPNGVMMRLQKEGINITNGSLKHFAS